MKMKHWTQLLPEAGTIARKGEQQIYLAEHIAKLERQLAETKRDYEEIEEKLHKTALREWTEEEIEKAKTESNSNNHTK